MNIKPQTSLSKILLIVAIAAGMIACTTPSGARERQPPPTEQPAPRQVQQPTQPTLPVVRMWPDNSRSPDGTVFAAHVASLIGALGRHKHQISGVEVVGFANGTRSIRNEVAEQFVWGDYPVILPFSPDMENAPHNARIFEEARRKYVEQQKAAYDQAAARTIGDYEQRTEKMLAALIDRLLAVPAAAAPCTHFSDLVERLQREQPTLNVIITDGIADCAGESSGSIPPVKIPGRIVILQVPANGDTAGSAEDIKIREDFLRSVFPDATIVPVYMGGQAIEELSL